MEKEAGRVTNDLKRASIILLNCNKKATLLRALNDFLEQEGSVQDEMEAPVVFGGQSQILLEMNDQISDVLEIIDQVRKDKTWQCV